MNAGTGGFDPQGDVRQALAAVVRDHGPAILSDPRHLGSLLNILLPTVPEEAGILVAAARAGASAQLAQQAATVGPGAALEAVSGNLAQSGVLDPPASRWAVGEIARAIGFPVSDLAPLAPPAPPPGAMAVGPGSGAVRAPPPAAPLGFPVVPAGYTPPPAPPQFMPPLAPSAYTPPGASPTPPTPSGPPPFSGPAAPPPFAPPPTPSPFAPSSAPPAFQGPGAPSAFPGPSAPSSFAGSGTPGPFGQGAPGGPPQGPQWAGAGVPFQPRPPSPPPGSGASAGPPPWTAPGRPTRKRGHPRALLAAAVVIVLVIGYFGVAALAGFFPFKAAAAVAPPTPTPTPLPTFTSTPTPSPSSSTAKPSSSASSSATGSPSLSPLGNLLPSHITANTADSCSQEPSDADVASGESGEELCDLTQNRDVAESYVLYAGFPTESLATTYFNSVLTANGMKVTQGSCHNLTLVTASDGSSQYCENTYTTTNTKSSSGSDFVFTGNPSFALGDSNAVSSLNVCSDVNSVDVLGFTDPTYAAVGIAISCLGTEQDQEVNSAFLAGDFFLGS